MFTVINRIVENSEITTDKCSQQNIKHMKIKQHWLKLITRDKTLREEICIFQHVLYFNGNFLQLTLVFSICLKWKSLKKLRMTIEEKTRVVKIQVSYLFLVQVILTLNLLLISASIIFWIVDNPYKVILIQFFNTTNASTF